MRLNATARFRFLTLKIFVGPESLGAPGTGDIRNPLPIWANRNLFPVVVWFSQRFKADKDQSNPSIRTSSAASQRDAATVAEGFNPRNRVDMTGVAERMG